jgi:hypothetical protein
MAVIVLALLLAQTGPSKEDVDGLVRRLSEGDIEAREGAERALGRLGLAELPFLEAHLASGDAETRARLKAAMGRILAEALTSEGRRVHFRPVAGREVHERWIAGGADRTKAPKGFEVIRGPERKDEVGHPHPSRPRRSGAAARFAGRSRRRRRGPSPPR